MVDLDQYAAQLSTALVGATDFLQQSGYTDPISRASLYQVKTVLPGVLNVQLSHRGMFQVTTTGGSYFTELGRIDNQARIVTLTPLELLDTVAVYVQKKGSTSPSTLPLEGILEHLVHEIKVLPQVLKLEMQGHYSETRELLGV